jgi:hypothetical protein
MSIGRHPLLAAKPIIDELAKLGRFGGIALPANDLLVDRRDQSIEIVHRRGSKDQPLCHQETVGTAGANTISCAIPAEPHHRILPEVGETTPGACELDDIERRQHR